MEASERRWTVLGELGRTMVTLSLVVGGAAALLHGLDAVPRYLLGEPRGIRAYATVEEAEQRVRARLYLPGYFPDTLRWPPAVIRLDAGPPRAVALTFVGRADGEERLFVLQSFGRPGADQASRLLPAGVRLQGAALDLRGAETQVARIAGRDGRLWHEVTWRSGERQVTLRYLGSLEDLLRMARSTGP